MTRAALAAEQVTSVRLRLALGVKGVRGLDLLDALQSSREALIAVADDRIGYIADRADLVLKLELLQLEDSGNWPHIADPDHRPEPDLHDPDGAGPAYGDIPSWVLVSGEIREIEQAPRPGVPPEAPEEEEVETASAPR